MGISIVISGMLGDERYSEFPNTPTIKEAGFRDFNVPLWYALYAPAETPRQILETLNREVSAITADRQFQALMEQRSVALRTSTLKQVDDFQRQQREMYRELIIKANIKAG